MAHNTSSFNFAENVNELLQYATVSAQFKLDEAIREVARESVKKLKSSSPGKKYPKGWAVKYEKGRFKVGATVYGKHGTYQIAHLLEHGHAKRNGGRTAPIVHIAPVEQWAQDEVQERFVQKMETN
ncbi:MAG: HK97 gp10 family phage protein [Oscillospiraceae bacterium]|nr:HK97 gp10 family phage protein [Oscillospiraceae bacterium]MBR3239848.1 HK97 gp10 family phage protein [Oscillospiraceae bacterium]